MAANSYSFKYFPMVTAGTFGLLGSLFLSYYYYKHFDHMYYQGKIDGNYIKKVLAPSILLGGFFGSSMTFVTYKAFDFSVKKIREVALNILGRQAPIEQTVTTL